jgi:hypothetical protein
MGRPGMVNVSYREETAHRSSPQSTPAGLSFRRPGFPPPCKIRRLYLDAPCIYTGAYRYIVVQKLKCSLTWLPSCSNDCTQYTVCISLLDTYCICIPSFTTGNNPRHASQTQHTTHTVIVVWVLVSLARACLQPCETHAV